MFTKEHALYRDRFRESLLNMGDDLAAVIRAQVMIEYYLQMAIEGALVNKDKLKARAWKEHLTFEIRVQLFQAIGATCSEFTLASPRALGKIRNDLAHTLATEVTEEQAVSFIETISPGGRTAMSALREAGDTWREDFRRALWMHIVEVQCDAHILKKRYDGVRPTIAEALTAYPDLEIKEMDGIPLALITDETDAAPAQGN